ncbi:protoporphyrinogen oxidase [Bacillus xiapuensis]|uniref:protoporphyrinogen oxidase n=1 Tax=Bacillus xiapuensis TaxID=2014075 RepID=UPI000C2432A8|nr:protoporphyrinogen oxidase [Bacillus xiapuensis]
MRKTVLVIGGGITGLAAMYELQKWKQEKRSDVRLILAESAGELGGKIRTVKAGSFVMEAGADSMVTRKAQAMRFIEELGLNDEVVYNATGRSFIYSEGELKPIPADAVFGIPASLKSLAESPLISAEGKVAALKDFYTKNHSFTKSDSVGSFLEHFLGKELVEKQIAPVLSGVYSGKLSELTIASTLPYLVDYKERYGSIIKGFEANKEKFLGGGERKFLSFKNGLGSLIRAYEERMKQVDILKKHTATRIRRGNGRYQVTFANHEIIEADDIILSIPHTAAAKLFDDPALAEEFSSLKTSSLISVYLGFDVPDSLLPAEGTGFIAANQDELSCNACTWTSRKWAHTSSEGRLLVRLFYKSSHPSYRQLKEMNKEELLQVALHDVNKSLGITEDPVVSEVTHWTDSMPNYIKTHHQHVSALENALAASYPGIWLSGCSYYGVGVPDCIENGRKTAQKIIKCAD